MYSTLKMIGKYELYKSGRKTDLATKGRSHVTINRLIDGLKKNTILNEIKINQLIAEKNPPTKKNK